MATLLCAVLVGTVVLAPQATAQLTDIGNQRWHQDRAGIAGLAQQDDTFGSDVASGDFDGDGVEDLAVGVPFEDIAGTADAGAVNVLYGSGGALTASGNQLWHQNIAGILDVAEEDERFGSAVASGDFDGDGFADLAVGVSLESADGTQGAGAVHVLYGSGGGLTEVGNQLWHQDSAGIEDVAEQSDDFGFALATGDFDGDGFADLAVGVPFEDIDGPTTSHQTGIRDVGAVNILYGSGGGLTEVGNQLWHQDSAGIVDVAEAFDLFGFALATGDFDGDGFADLAVGVPFEDIAAAENAGAVNVIYGSAGGLTEVGNQLWHQDSAGIEDTAELFDEFGLALASGDFDGDGFADLAVGVPVQNISAGAVNVIYGSGGGLTEVGNQLWHQDSAGIQDVVENGDLFGSAVASGDFDGDGFADLAVGVLGEDIVPTANAGAVNVLYGSGGGLTEVGNQLWHQDSAGIRGMAEEGDEFGAALASGDFDGDGAEDLAVGVPGENITGTADAGAVNVLYGHVPPPTATPTEGPSPTPTLTPTEGPSPTPTLTATMTDTLPTAQIGTATPALTPTATATVIAESTSTPTATPPADSPGDVDCNDTTNAIDAALILQLDVGLITELECPENGDLSADGTINSIDAAIVLQCDAGIIDCESLAGVTGRRSVGHLSALW